MYTDVIISNMALSHVGTAGIIENLQSDTHPNAIACRTWYEISKRHVLRSFEWPFAKDSGPLNLLENLDRQVYQWTFRYQKPVDSIKFLKINGDTRNESRDTRVPFEPFADGIYTDRKSAVGQWIIGSVGDDLFTDDFALALSHKLASLIASTVTRGDDFNVGEKEMLNFENVISEAKASSANESQDDVEPP